MIGLYLGLLFGQVSSERTDELAVLRAAVQQWQSDVTFKSTFTLRVGLAASLDDGINRGIDDKLSKSSRLAFKAHGVFNKLGRKVRYSLDYGKYLQLAPDKIGHVAVDETSNRDILVRYTPLQAKNFGDIATIERRDRLNIPEIAAGYTTASEINPIKPMRTDESDPFGDYPLISTRKIDDEHIELTTGKSDLHGTTNKRTVRFWMNPSPPVVEQIHHSTKFANGGGFDCSTRLTDFRQCPEGLVARRIVFAYQEAESTATVWEWMSSDLGDQRLLTETLLLRLRLQHRW